MGVQEIRRASIEKAAKMRSVGHNPYPWRFERSHLAADILASHEALTSTGSELSVAGRLMTHRSHGKAVFADLMDSSGRIQIYVRQDVVGEAQFELFKNLLGSGDFVGVRGHLFTTNTGEVTIKVDDFQILSKSLLPLPGKWHGLRDIEVRYRQRYLDLIMNPDVRRVFLTRTQIIEIVRRVFNAKGGIEVETPTLQPLYGGASARPFETYHNTLKTVMYLRIADELYLKRLIVGGFDCVYEICKDFRNEGMDRSHNPEFTMVEIYWAYRDYTDMMELTEELFTTIAQEVAGSLVITYQDTEIDLTPPWRRRPMLELIRDFSGVDVAALSDEELRSALAQAIRDEQGHLEGDALARREGRLPTLDRGGMIEELFDLKVERNLIQPTFVTDYPKETSPLAKVHRVDPTLTERFELYIYGREMANAFSELNDPLDQRERFEAQMRLIDSGDEQAQPLDEDFLRALEYGMPPTGGLGIGIDRLVMLFTNQRSIQEVILFPQMRQESRFPELVGGDMQGEGMQQAVKP